MKRASHRTALELAEPGSESSGNKARGDQQQFHHAQFLLADGHYKLKIARQS